MTKIISLNTIGIDKTIDEVVKSLKAGALVVFPSDTVYGLLVDARNELAVSKLIEFKNRAPGKAISVFVSDFKMLREFGVVADDKKDLLLSVLPGPFTVILQSKNRVDKRLQSEKGTLGIRLTQFQPVQDLVKRYGSPLTATSANLGGKSPHYSIKSLLNQLPKFKKDMLDLIIDASSLPRNKPSTILDFTTENIKILRHGDVILGKKDEFISNSPKETRAIASFLYRKSQQLAADKPVVFLIKGDLGAGKTEFTRGVAKEFGIEKIVSPTFVIYYEYDVKSSSPGEADKRKFIHADFYNIQDTEEFDNLKMERYLQLNNFMICEWGERLGEFYKIFKEKAVVYVLEIDHVGEKTRKITFAETK